MGERVCAVEHRWCKSMCFRNHQKWATDDGSNPKEQAPRWFHDSFLLLKRQKSAHHGRRPRFLRAICRTISRNASKTGECRSRRYATAWRISTDASTGRKTISGQAFSMLVAQKETPRSALTSLRAPTSLSTSCTTLLLNRPSGRFQSLG